MRVQAAMTSDHSSTPSRERVGIICWQEEFPGSPFNSRWSLWVEGAKWAKKQEAPQSGGLIEQKGQPTWVQILAH